MTSVSIIFLYLLSPPRSKRTSTLCYRWFFSYSIACFNRHFLREPLRFSISRRQYVSHHSNRMMDLILSFQFSPCSRALPTSMLILHAWNDTAVPLLLPPRTPRGRNAPLQALGPVAGRVWDRARWQTPPFVNRKTQGIHYRDWILQSISGQRGFRSKHAYTG